MKKRDKLFEKYGTKSRVWLCEFEEDVVRDSLMFIAHGLLSSATSQANAWLYGKHSANWNYGWNTAEEKALLRNYPDKFYKRRLAFMRHVLSTVATKHPDLVDGLMEGQCES